MLSTEPSLMKRTHRELLDHSDEELELCDDGHDLNALFDEHVEDGSEKAARRLYFSELLRLPYEEVEVPMIELPQRVRQADYTRSPAPAQIIVPQFYCLTGFAAGQTVMADRLGRAIVACLGNDYRPRAVP